MVLLDSDVARKCCQYGLVDELVHSYGCLASDVAVLPQLRFQLRIGKPAAVAKLGTEAAVAAAESFLAKAKEVQLSPEAANLVLSLQIPGIDTGEQVLFAALLMDQSSQLLTGDKRALATLATVPDAASAWPRIRALEHAILRILSIEDFSRISAKIRSCPDADMSLSLAFGRTAPATKDSVVEGLSSYVNELIARTLGYYCGVP